jgi:hypothetical protein
MCLSQLSGCVVVERPAAVAAVAAHKTDCCHVHSKAIGYHNPGRHSSSWPTCICQMGVSRLLPVLQGAAQRVLQ